MHIHQSELTVAHVVILMVCPEYGFPTLKHKLTPTNTLVHFTKSTEAKHYVH